jgi:hypothetical protein
VPAESDVSESAGLSVCVAERRSQGKSDWERTG